MIGDLVTRLILVKQVKIHKDRTAPVLFILRKIIFTKKLFLSKSATDGNIIKTESVFIVSSVSYSFT